MTVQNQQYLLGGSGPPYRNLIESGIHIGGGTDASAISPMSPWISLYHMVTGRGVSGNVINAGQQISRVEALRLYTTGSAWYTFDDEQLGSIEVGKLADLVVLSDDYLTVPDEEIRTLSSVLTIIDGKFIHATKEFAYLITSVRDLGTPFIPETFVLLQNYPNPFNPTTTIIYEIPKSSFVTLKVYNIAGQMIATLVDGQKSAGRYAVKWNAANVSSGVYIYRITAGNFSDVKKSIVLK